MTSEHLIIDEMVNETNPSFTIKLPNGSEKIYKNVIRGTIMNKFSTLVPGVPRVFEFTETEIFEAKQLMDQISTNANEWEFTYSREGTLVRLYFFNNMWNLVTLKKDAYSSRWGSDRTFGEIFDEYVRVAFGNLYSLYQKLDTDCVYSFFLVTNNTNRIVSFYDEDDNDKLYLVGISKAGQKLDHVEFAINNNFLYNITINVTNVWNTPDKSSPYENLECACEDLECVLMQLLEIASKDPYLQFQGILITHVPTQIQLKVYVNKYKELFDLRGNDPDVIHRYLVLWVNSYKDIVKYEILYPDHKKQFVEIMGKLMRLTTQIKTQYIKRFIRPANAPPDYYPAPIENHDVFGICVRIHKWHNENRAVNKVNDSIIHHILVNTKWVIVRTLLDKTSL